MLKHGATGVGIANISMDGDVLDVWFPSPALIDPASYSAGTERLGAQDLPVRLLNLVKLDNDRMVEQVAVRTVIRDLSLEPQDPYDVYLRLHLLSHRLVEPNTINMTQALEKLSVVVWTNKGPCLPDNFEFMRTSLRSRGLIHVYGIDPLPRMVDYVVPSGIQISEAERVRLGAYLAPGTRVLREGFVSHNAGTLGACTVEGRISSGTVIDAGCTLMLSSSLMSSKPQPMRIGKNCTFGVSSSVLGLDLGDRCHIGHKVVLEPGTLLRFADTGGIAPAQVIAGQSDWSITMHPDYREPFAEKIAS
ncbi:succinyltransferase [Corynebacterium sp. ES2794-CONJ1]|uniref:DapH/DapD/GlmU-related protein n=1 Tax=unclassified Corynebacterium TaxID=2624378 RepID=UPI002169516B|nr:MULTISPECIES: DapH/DapD/GlmU-related protein [unclassified Corynebacterium]MCS4489883.1 succinyltransferase [Corynebacterium sp. ES2775-CONJ]MCS4491753.1 succinyltransferase [Corynebacterium sp. ES2715-CONJ3]MCS4531858.1 succinyltransferase [Corynebacterium sp. ES2730-CONJ]MCU9519255.1 succinyltransferase [Corynebacterium sp. ES2794-CONJ1]